MNDYFHCNANSETCGWIAAILAMICFGSFGVPIKGDAANSVDIDPLVMQSYKTFMCFVTSFFVLPLGVEFTFTPWGIVSGLFWVPSGVLAIYAIRNAGLAVSQGTWSSIIVLVSFIWGIFIFKEPVKSIALACFAIVLMIIGLWGMSYYSAPTTTDNDNIREQDMLTDDDDDLPHQVSSTDDDDGLYNQSFQQEEEERLNVEEEDMVQQDVLFIEQQQSSLSQRKKHTTLNDTCRTTPFQITKSSSSISPTSSRSLQQPTTLLPYHCGKGRRRKDVIFCFGNVQLSRRNAGLIAACANGLWGGSIMVPMHYSGKSTRGLGYVISFAIGATIITILLWILRYAYHLYKTKGSFVQSYYMLPSFHFKVMWLPGCIAGTLWSIGNVGSIISVHRLGEGVGYSVVQASMFVSGLWGIFWYKEVKGFWERIKWFCSAIVTLIGILLLSYEHGT
mmetsp:Transcript_23842/g.31682  ORF Transcript_23842/g.31682 Transcript_23842/m.31682 type:complete len:449 (-) Transcript_23842:89-1435(-)